MNEKALAYRAVRTALNNGRLVRPDRCGRCGRLDAPCSDGRSRIHAHHHDYSRPLDVEWICAKCHREETPLPARIGGPAIGEINGQAKLNEADVRAMRRLRATTGMPYAHIAKRFSVDKKTAMRAIKGLLWSHVTDTNPSSTPSKAEGE